MAGVGLTLDEFALWIYLQDVYWANEGRDSFDAVVVAVVFASLILVGDPSGSDRARRSAERFARVTRRRQRITNLIAGAPSEPEPIAPPSGSDSIHGA